MFLVDLSDLFNALATLQKVIGIRWWCEHETREDYLEVRRDIQILEQNIYALREAIREVVASCPDLTLQPSTTSSISPWGLSQILGNLTETLEDCWELLGDNESLPIHEWHPPVKDEVDIQHDRIVFLNIKLSIVLGSLNLTSFSPSLQRTISSCTQWPGKEPHLLGSYFEKDKASVLESQSGELESPRTTPEVRRGSFPPAIAIPQQIDQTLSVVAMSRYVSLVSVPIIDGLNEIVFYLDRATQWHDRRNTAESIRNNQSCKLAFAMWAHWLLRAIQAGDEYRVATSQLTNGDPQLKLPYYGMTLPRFFSTLEERILHVHKLLLIERPDPYPATHLQNNIERERNIWQEYFWQSATQKDFNNPRNGGKMMRARLKSTNPAVREYLEVFPEHGEEQAERCLNLITSATDRADRVYKVDLSWVHLGPIPATLNLADDIYSVIFKQNRSSGMERGDPISFVRKKDLFRFQTLITGYRVVDDLPGAQITCQYSDKWKLWKKGAQSTNPGRIQLWTANNRPDSDSGGRVTYPWDFELVPSSIKDSSLALTSRPMSIVSIPSIASRPPRLPPLPFSQVSALSVQSATPSTRAPSAAGSSIRTVTNQSFTTPRPTSMTSVIPIDRAGKVGAIIETPECPCLVIFLPDMLLSIDVNDETNIAPGRCDCQEEEEQSKGSGLPRCTRVVLESRKKYISSKRTPPVSLSFSGTATSGWNLASAGRYQRDIPACLEEVKTLRLVILEFGEVKDRLRFGKYFQDLQELYRVNRRGAV